MCHGALNKMIYHCGADNSESYGHVCTVNEGENKMYSLKITECSPN